MNINDYGPNGKEFHERSQLFYLTRWSRAY